jgi:hypothetical protein
MHSGSLLSVVLLASLEGGGCADFQADHGSPAKGSVGGSAAAGSAGAGGMEAGTGAAGARASGPGGEAGDGGDGVIRCGQSDCIPGQEYCYTFYGETEDTNACVAIPQDCAQIDPGLARCRCIIDDMHCPGAPRCTVEAGGTLMWANCDVL